MEETTVLEKATDVEKSGAIASVTTTGTTTSSTNTTGHSVNQGPDWELPADYKATSVLPPANGDVSQNSSHPGFSKFNGINGINGLNGLKSRLTSGYTSFSIATRTRFDRIFPPSKTYTRLKWKRRTFVLSLLALILAVLALILGLAIGLTERKKQHSGGQNLPLPTGSTVYHGDLTYYEPGLGACGITSTADQNIVAVSHSLWDSQSTGSNPNSNPLCGRKIRVQNYDTRVDKLVSLDVTVVDRCVGCQPTDLDVSPGAFDKLADPTLGRIHGVGWAWI